MEKQYCDSGTAAAASSPPWVMLKRIGCKQDSIVAEAQAAATACTSTNLLLHVSLLLAAPPGSSTFYFGWSDSASGRDDREGKKVNELRVVAVHGDAVLLRVKSSYQRKSAYGFTTDVLNSDYFLYEAGTGMARPPLLLMLPRCYLPTHYDKEPRLRSMPVARTMYSGETGLLRCGQDELLVAQLALPFLFDKDKPWDRAELCVLRVGQEWELKQGVPIVSGDQDSKGAVVMQRWQPDAAVAVGDRYQCWVDYLLGFLFCDMSADDDSLMLRYVALPVLPPEGVSYFDGGRSYMINPRDLGDAGAGAVRFVQVEPSFSFTVTTWTLSLSMDEPLEWVKDGVLDCDDLWALPAYEGLPQVPLEFPIVSLDNADVIWFMVRERDYANLTYMRVWMVEIDTRSKALLSVIPYSEASLPDSHVAVKLRC